MSAVAIKVSELSGAALDWAVAKAIGLPVFVHTVREQMATIQPGDFTDFEKEQLWKIKKPRLRIAQSSAYSTVCPSFSVDWIEAGPVLHKHAVALKPADAWQEYGNNWQGTCITTRADADHSFHHQQGDTPLIAGMRAIVGSILGDTIEVPSELLEQSA